MAGIALLLRAGDWPTPPEDRGLLLLQLRIASISLGTYVHQDARRVARQSPSTNRRTERRINLVPERRAWNAHSTIHTLDHLQRLSEAATWCYKRNPCRSGSLSSSVTILRAFDNMLVETGSHSRNSLAFV